MTSPYVTPYAPPHATPPAPRSHPVLRALLAVTAVVAGIVGAGMCALIGAITWTGCFIGCSNPNRAGGAALFALAAVSLASGPAAVSGLYRSAGWMRAAAVTLGLALTAALLVMAAA